jgi:LysM repeat protein
MKLTKIFGIVLSLHVAVILLVMFQPGCQTFPGKGKEQASEEATTDDPSPGFNSGLEAESIKPGATKPEATAGGERSPPTPPTPGELLVPTEPGADSAVSGGLRPSGVKVYQVQKGDSLWSIAQKHNLTVDRLLSANDVAKNATLQIGQEIFLPVSGESVRALITPEEPEPSSTGIEVHVVMAGDTLSVIARTYGVSVNAIKDANNLRNDLIQIGQRLLVPGGVSSVASPSTEPAPVPAAPVVAGQTTHVVQAGESLTSIARRYGISAKLLADMNNVTNPDAVKIGQVLIVKPAPVTNEDPSAPVEGDPDSIESIFRNAGEAPVVPLPPKSE